MPETHWRQKNFWGEAFYLNHIDHPYYTFVMFRDTFLRKPDIPGIPEVGDEIHWPDDNGVAHLIIGEVRRERDPPDMYWIKAWMIGKMVVPTRREEPIAS